MAVSANLAYRGAVAIWIFVTLIQPLVFIVVWRTVAGSGETGGYTANQFVAYFLVMMLVDHLTFIWHMWEFEWRIRTGAFSPLLMRPIHPIHNDVCENLAYKTVGLVGVLPAAVLLGLVFDADLSGVTVLHGAAFPDRAGPGHGAALRGRVVPGPGGVLADQGDRDQLPVLRPDHLLRRGVRAAGGAAGAGCRPSRSWTPFPWSLAFPVEVLLGRRTGAEIWIGYAAQLGWIALALGGLALLWRRATRRYSAVGA